MWWEAGWKVGRRSGGCGEMWSGGCFGRWGRGCIVGGGVERVVECGMQ